MRNMPCVGLTCEKACGMIRVVSKDYIDRKSKYKNYVLGCCADCRHVQLYRVTDDFVIASNWGSIEKCGECEGLCYICVLSKYQKPPGFARKCNKCDFKFTCATTKIKGRSAILVGVTTMMFEAEDIIREEV